MCEVEPDSVEKGMYIRLRPHDKGWEVIGARLRWGGPPSDQALMADGAFLALTLLLYLLNYLFIDVNKSSLHGFYRDRLSKLYLFRKGKNPQSPVVPNDEQKLSELNGKDSVAPYHLINTTINLQGVEAPSARGRSSGFFLFSKHYCGGPHTTYAPTEDMQKWDKHINLGTAMAISAAAAAPNMGSTTVRSLSFILTLLNFRLGYWVPNPEPGARERGAVPWGAPRAGSWQLLSEAAGSLNAEGALVNLSDGGHLENLAIYELLCRKCSTIVAIDGEADPDLAFNGLVTLIRLAKIDLGVTIEIDLGRLKWGPDRHTRGHYAIGEIHYGPKHVGTLVYVKSSVTGDEDPFVKKYRADNPTFPHETTADQFFDETQFEAYRALGEHIGGEVVEGIAGKKEKVYGFENVKPLED